MTVMFHITQSDNIPSIMEEGLHSPFGNYMSASLENAARFIALRAVFDKTKWVALEIDIEGLSVERSNDHSVEFFGTDDSWVTMSRIDSDRIVAAYEIVFGDQQETV